MSQALESSPYAMVRVAVMRSKLIDKSHYEKLLHMSSQEISHFLGQTEYGSEMKELGLSLSGIELIEQALNRNYVNIIKKLKRISPPSFAEVIDTYLLRNDAENIKTLVRAQVAKQEAQETKKMLLPGKIDASTLLDLSVEQILAQLKEPFHKIKASSLFEIETEVDRRAYTTMFDLSQQLYRKVSLFSNFLMTLIEMVDIITCLKIEDAQPYLFNSTKEIKSLLSNSVEQRREIMQERLQANSLSGVELALYKQAYVKTRLFQHQDPFSVYAVLGYLFAKEIEMRNIRKIIQAKHLGIEGNVVSEQLIV